MKTDGTDRAREVAEILRECVIPRAKLIAWLIVESSDYIEKEKTTVFHMDNEVDAIVADIVNLCEALAVSLEGGSPSNFDSQLDAKLVERYWGDSARRETWLPRRRWSFSGRSSSADGRRPHDRPRDDC